MAPLPSRLKSCEVVIERGSLPNRFQAQWLIYAYEKIAPTAPQRSPSLISPGHSILEATENFNDLKGTS